MRLAKQFDQAEALCTVLEPNVPAEWRAAWDNEMAALAWHRGDADQAVRRWAKAEPSLPVMFNRGMANLFTGRFAEASEVFKNNIVERIPESSGWHHLARLYLTLAGQH